MGDAPIGQCHGRHHHPSDLRVSWSSQHAICRTRASFRPNHVRPYDAPLEFVAPQHHAASPQRGDAWRHRALRRSHIAQPVSVAVAEPCDARRASRARRLLFNRPSRPVHPCVPALRSALRAPVEPCARQHRQGRRTREDQSAAPSLQPVSSLHQGPHTPQGRGSALRTLRS